MSGELSGRYVHLRQGVIAAYEGFSLRRDGDGWIAFSSKKTVDESGSRHLEVEATLSGDWRIQEMTAKKGGCGAEFSVSYRWYDGGWGGSISGPQGARDCCVPLAQGLEASCPLALFDALLFRRLHLPPSNQIRAEFLQLSEETLEIEQTYRIIERLDDALADWKGSSVSAGRYRLSGPTGEEENLLAHPAGVCLFKKTAGDQLAYRLLEMAEA